MGKNVMSEETMHAKMMEMKASFSLFKRIEVRMAVSHLFRDNSALEHLEKVMEKEIARGNVDAIKKELEKIAKEEKDFDKNMTFIMTHLLLLMKAHSNMMEILNKEFKTLKQQGFPSEVLVKSVDQETGEFNAYAFDMETLMKGMLQTLQTTHIVEK